MRSFPSKDAATPPATNLDSEAIRASCLQKTETTQTTRNQRIEVRDSDRAVSFVPQPLWNVAVERSGCGLGWFIDFLFATRKDEAEGVEIRIQADQVRLIFLHATLETCVLSRQQATRTTMRGRSPYHGLQNPKQCWCRTKATMTNRRLRHMWSVWSTLCLLLPNFPTNFLQEEASPADEDEDSEAAITPVSRQSLASVSASLSQSYRKRPARHEDVVEAACAFLGPPCIFCTKTFLQEQASQANEDEDSEASVTHVRRHSLSILYLPHPNKLLAGTSVPSGRG